MVTLSGRDLGEPNGKGEFNPPNLGRIEKLIF